MSKREVLAFCNEAITLCNGKPVTVGSNVQDADLDQLGYLLLFASINNHYNILKDIDEDLVMFKQFLYMPVKQVINLCVLSS